jgi:hypothetical protein
MSKKKRGPKQTRKPRQTQVRIVGGSHIFTGMNIDDDGVLTFFDENGKIAAPVNVEIAKIYDRAKGAKVLTRVPTEFGNIQIDPNHVLGRFASVLAIDTNTEQIDGVTVSISAAVLLHDIEVDVVPWNAKLKRLQAFEFHGAQSHHEHIGWANLIIQIADHPEIPKPIGLIVDCDLDRLTHINLRAEALFGTFYLPEGIQLIYGSSERGTREFIANAAMAHCDRLATELLSRVRRAEQLGEYQLGSRTPYWRYRYINVN